MAESIKVMLSEEQIDKRIREMGKQISEDYAQSDGVVVVAVLKGAAFFACELAKRIKGIPVTMDFMATSSYGSGTSSTGDVKIKKDVDISVEGKDVIIVEDIIDSGNTLYFLSELFKTRNARSIRLCALLNKPERREVEVPMDYIGFDIPNEFVVGYGLDFDQKYRNLPYVGIVIFD